ncbi:hypothetical protein H0H81_000694 [Sphagnurus paluster]|uniref:choline-phosphate cytidylyltransferase n=1 Tax=Sphagnurus paluster TaxID=117069 RepID=A0A9P7GUM7_9AGAR|nr:hypothetical protein H0H81_000694 [Sphagnurus paluster]
MDAPSVLSDDDYDVVSSMESSLNDYGHIATQMVREPPPSKMARDKFESVSWTVDEIQDYTRRSLGVSESGSSSSRTRRVYVDGIFDGFNVGHALQLRQAKLSFPSVYLIVGVYPDHQLQLHGYIASLPDVERCEVVRHCRWVDELIGDAPWVLDSQFLDNHKIDYVALDEGTSVDPAYDKARIRGYDTVKSLSMLSFYWPFAT